mgnify:CR=1 FL=1
MLYMKKKHIYKIENMVLREEQTLSFTYFLGLGSNLGTRIQNLVNALVELRASGIAIAVSDVYETEPVGGPQQDYYLNLACALETLLEPIELLHLAKTIELNLGRQEGERWGPRLIDIDILAAGQVQVDVSELVIPHPRLAERLFVCRPLADLKSDFIPPGMGITVEQMAHQLKDSAKVELRHSRNELLRRLPEGDWCKTL